MTDRNLTVGIVRSMLDYEPSTGEFVWKWRSDIGLATNVRQCGLVAGRIDSKGYRRIAIHRRAMAASRLAWLLSYGEWPKGEVDHINGNPQDDRLANLRLATRSQNLANSRNRGRNPKGTRRLSSGRYGSRARVAGVHFTLGTFDTEEQAHHAYMVFARMVWGPFACDGSREC